MSDALPESIRIEKVIELTLFNPILQAPQHPKYNIQTTNLNSEQELIRMLRPQTPPTPNRPHNAASPSLSNTPPSILSHSIPQKKKTYLIPSPLVAEGDFLG